jgi:hypothetical protein
LTTLYGEARKGHKTRYLDGKKCATPPMAGTQSTFIAGPLGFIAVQKTATCQLDNLSWHLSFACLPGIQYQQILS